jgi:hypothetical protein
MMSLLLVWPGFERTTRGSSSADWCVAHTLRSWIRLIELVLQDVQADEDAFKKSEEEERAMQARIRKVQEGVNNARQQSARRKMDKIEAREWDTGKKDEQPATVWGREEEREKEGKARDRGRGRGRGGRGRGRGRGQGQGNSAAADPWAPTTSGAEANGGEWGANLPEWDVNQPTQH